MSHANADSIVEPSSTVKERQLDGLELPAVSTLPDLPLPSSVLKRRQIDLPIHLPIDLGGLDLPVDLPLPTVLDVPSTGLKARQLDDLALPLPTGISTGDTDTGSDLLDPLNGLTPTVPNSVGGLVGGINL